MQRLTLPSDWQNSPLKAMNDPSGERLAMARAAASAAHRVGGTGARVTHHQPGEQDQEALGHPNPRTTSVYVSLARKVMTY
jgi:hypothetical protein